MIIKTYREYFKKNETEVLIIVDKKKYLSLAKKKILELRNIIEKYILLHPYFKITTKPYNIDIKAHKILQKMILASLKTNTGPMSSIAGAIAHEAIKYIKNKGCKFAIIDNGGDISIYNSISKNNVILKIETGTQYFQNIALLVKQKKTIYGFCTSSSTIGKSISFGIADSVTVISKNTAIADAAATAICNSTKLKSKRHINSILNYLSLIKEISGIIIIKDNYIGTIGKIPKIINLENKIF